MRPRPEVLRAARPAVGVAILLLHGSAAHAAVRDVETLPTLVQFGATIAESPAELRAHLQRLVELLRQGDDAEALRYLRELAAREPAVASDLHERLAGMYLRERRLYRATQHLDAVPNAQRTAQARYLAAQVAARQQRLEAAIALLEWLVRRFPDDPLVARDEAQLAALLGRPGQAAAACERLLKQQPRDTEATLLLARMRVQQGRLTEARQLLSGVLAREPRHGRAALQLGLVQLATGELQSARESFLRARTVEAGNATPYAAEAAVALLSGDRSAARRAAAGAWQQNPADRLAGLVEVLSNPSTGSPPSPGSPRWVAAGLYPDLDTEPLPSVLRPELAASTAAGRIAVGQLLIEQLSPRAALDLLDGDAGVTRGPLQRLAAVRAQVEAGDLAQAATELAALERSEQARGLAAPAVQSALLAARRNDRASAQAAMARAVQLAPRSPRIRMLAGDLYLALGEPARAVPEYRTALEQWPREPRLLNQLAHALAGAGTQQDREQALAYTATALAQQPHYLLRAAILDTRADLLFRLARMGEALAAYRDLSTTVGGMTTPQQWHRLGDLAHDAGDTQLARRAYEEALDYGRGYPGRAVAMQRVDAATATDTRK